MQKLPGLQLRMFLFDDGNFFVFCLLLLGNVSHSNIFSQREFSLQPCFRAEAVQIFRHCTQVEKSKKNKAMQTNYVNQTENILLFYFESGRARILSGTPSISSSTFFFNCDDESPLVLSNNFLTCLFSSLSALPWQVMKSEYMEVSLLRTKSDSSR